jgi:hypothetical protein
VFFAFSSPMPHLLASFSVDIRFLDQAVFIAATFTFGSKQFLQFVSITQLVAHLQEKTFLFPKELEI